MLGVIFAFWLFSRPMTRLSSVLCW